MVVHEIKKGEMEDLFCYLFCPGGALPAGF
jgi:hypothetical protein